MKVQRITMKSIIEDKMKSLKEQGLEETELYKAMEKKVELLDKEVLK